LIDCGYRVDILVEQTLIVELKSVDRLLPIHEAQLLTYMKLASRCGWNECTTKDTKSTKGGREEGNGV